MIRTVITMILTRVMVRSVRKLTRLGQILVFRGWPCQRFDSDSFDLDRYPAAAFKLNSNR